MQMVNMTEAISDLSRLVDAIEQGKETEFVIEKNGRPTARLVAIDAVHSKHIGVAKGIFEFHGDDEQVAKLFLESSD